MTTEPGRVRDLPTILGDLATGPYPDYIDDVLTSTAGARQRPAWTFLNRWLPMIDTARPAALVPGHAWRTASLALLVLAVLLAAVAMVAGALQTRLPAPYGPARNGAVAYASAGDIYVADPATGTATALLTGPEMDIAPRFSPDGTRIVFERRLAGVDSHLLVVPVRGGEPTLITPQPVQIQDFYPRPARNYEFSPDGEAVVFMANDQTGPSIFLANTDGSGVRRLDVGRSAFEPTFRPDGTEVLFMGGVTSSTGNGIFAVDLANGRVRTLKPGGEGYDLAGPAWSPDGSRVSYWQWDTNSLGLSARTHVMTAEGTDDRVLPTPEGSVWNALATWSNDGTRIFMMVGHTPDFSEVGAAIVNADGSGTTIEIPYEGTVQANCCSFWIWSPDDSTILGRPTDVAGQPGQQLLVDVAARLVRPAPWTAASDPTWQRLAP